MSSATDDRAFRERMGRIQTLLDEAQRLEDPLARARTAQIVQGLMDLHAAALEKMLATIGDPVLIGRLARDDLIGSVLLLYGLHPVDLGTRVRQALDQARPLLLSHGGNVELVDLVDGLVRLRLVGSCHGCPSSSATLQGAIEEAIYGRAPDVAGIEVIDAMEAAMPAGPSPRLRMALPMISA